MKRNSGFALIALAALLGWGWFTQEAAPEQETSQTVGTQRGNLAPDFSLMTAEGEAIRLSDLRGKKVIVNLWATWCPPCRAEIPDMQAFYEANKDNGVAILGVNLTATETSVENVAAFVKTYGMTFPVLLDVDKEVGSQFQAISIPTSYIIDSRGVIREKFIGPMDQEKMEKMISSLE
ncbi:TlpA family protein disulfide reductase [Brevibacillus nitrificans]|uniref:TlpA family protein disulfide reductase n=1 Tax=Brevibacillus nitrificans TaxID=651560 RepID=A0A3M8D7Y9_9BACL|nr:TlpA disulfide reductase family protein [Brevibacillus nitrificans]RNB83751.1 TlpA family protein disulfide reductase [Brevibacillus nitrificans]